VQMARKARVPMRDKAGKEYRYKFLVYPNITNQKDLEKDSFVISLGNTIRSLNSIRKDIHFTVLITEEVKSLKAFKNVEQVIYDLPITKSTMRAHFDTNQFLKVVDWKNNDFDVIYSQLPEHTSQLVNVLHNKTNLRPVIVGYCHWYEIDENSTYDKRSFLANLVGTLQMTECGVNSQWLKNLVLKKAGEYFNEDMIARLDKIIQVQPPGVDFIHRGRSRVKPKSILFNHRPDNYTGLDWFIQVLDRLYKRRKDFTLYTTLAGVNRPYAKQVDIEDRKKYLRFLRQMYLGVGTFEKYSAWSVSTTDGLSQGVPYLLPNRLCYPEMVGENYPLFYDGRDDFEKKLIYALDHPTKINRYRNQVKQLSQKMLWKKRMREWFNDWKFLDELPTVDKTNSFKKIVKFIKRHGSVTKNDILEYMGWGAGIGWSKYRNLLRQEPEIRFTKSRYIHVKRSH
jgi:glycosyltransferase involved in cell wall biosynthesis